MFQIHPKKNFVSDIYRSYSLRNLIYIVTYHAHYKQGHPFVNTIQRL